MTGGREELQYDFDSQFERFKVVPPCTATIYPLSLLEDFVTLSFKLKFYVENPDLKPRFRRSVVPSNSRSTNSLIPKQSHAKPLNQLGVTSRNQSSAFSETVTFAIICSFGLTAARSSLSRSCLQTRLRSEISETETLLGSALVFDINI